MINWQIYIGVTYSFHKFIMLEMDPFNVAY
jgi:hypothetical protein